jgi:prephenate dehydratase
VVSKRFFRGNRPPEADGAFAFRWKNSPLTEREIVRAYARTQEVRSHPLALLQCKGFLDINLPRVATEADHDTATAAKAISANEDGKVAAIASKCAAQIYDVCIVAENIEDDSHNMTRFLVLGRTPLRPADVQGPALTTILFQTNHKPGSLLNALKPFAEHGINLTKLETYMVSQKRPDPTFYVDIGGSLGDSVTRQAIDQLMRNTISTRILGSYPASPHRGKKNSFLPI